MNLLDFLFPRTCLGCGKADLPTEFAESAKKVGQYFCPSCTRKIKLIENQVCPVCEKPSPYGAAHRFCQGKYSLDGLISFFAYEGIIRKAIHQLKFKYTTDLAEEFFGLMRERWEMRKIRGGDRFLQIEQFVGEKRPVIISVPLYWYKENQRGFNQSEIFAQKFARDWNLDFKKDFLIRAKFTPSQAGLTQEQRKKNIENAFSVFPIVHNPLFNILLIDDIWTTGATLKTCGSLLKKAGAKEVWGLTLAR